MVTPSELLRVLVFPLIVSACLAAIGRWRGWAWTMPLALGAGFLAGYAMLGVPRLPPRDGTDWLFWLAVPATLEVELELTIEAESGGFLLIYESRDGSVRGDTWHDTLPDAHEQARTSFGVPPGAWQPVGS